MNLNNQMSNMFVIYCFVGASVDVGVMPDYKFTIWFF